MEFGCDWDTVPNSLAGSEPGLNRARKMVGNLARLRTWYTKPADIGTKDTPYLIGTRNPEKS